MRFLPERSPLLRLLLFSFFPLFLGCLILVRLAPDFVLGVAHCPLRETTGLPCPTCGSTLAATELVAGQWLPALQANPLVVVLGALYVLAAGYAAVATVMPRWRREVQLSDREKKSARWLAISLLLANWLWLASRYLA